MEKNLGHATAYGYAKSKGYSGTEDEFAELMADYASVGQSAAQSASEAAASATSASGSAATASQAAQTATSKAEDAVTAAGTATTKASEASQSASTASSAATSAGTSAQTASTAASTATTKASEASESATTATTAKTDAETARDAAAQSASEAAESARTLTIDATLTQSGQAADAKAVGDDIDSLKSVGAKALAEVDSVTNRIKDIDGHYYLDPNNFEIGKILISASGWIYYSDNAKRVRTKEGVTYHLSVGDVISLSNYTDARFYLGWKNGNNEYKYAGWNTEDYTVIEDGDYVILLANVTEVDQTSIYALFNLLSIKTSNYALTEIDNEFAEQDTKLFNAFVYNQMGIPFTANEAYISSKFKPNPNRISFDMPYPFYKGSKIDITVGTGEKFYLMYFRKVNNTGSKNTDYERISGSTTEWQTTNKSYTAVEDMYIYVTAAFAGDTAITKDTVKTKAVITKAYASADVDELPAYWKTYLQTKNGEINAAMDDIGGIGDAFVFYTDPHWGNKNQKHTPQIIQNMLENTALRSVYCGGDVIDSGSGGFTEYCKAFREITVFTARGNHDQNPNAQDASDIVPDSEYYNRILKPIEYLVNTDGRLYFYRDNASEKIRYIFMDSGSYRADTLNTTQLTWMQNALTELDSDWSALVIQHVVFTGAEASSTEPLNFAGQGTKTISAINAVWEQMQCTFIGIVCGHVHRDYATTESTYGYPIIATSCDVGGTGRTQYDPVNGATPETTDEHIIDIFLIDKENKTINTIRIGAGQNRTFSYGS